MTTQTAGPLSEPELFNGYGHPVRLRAPLTASPDAYQRVLTDRIAELWAWRAWYRSRADWGSFIELRRQHAAELRALVRLARKARRATPAAPVAETSRPSALVRRRTVAGCPTCDADPDGFRPYHDASLRCESGGRPHCSCGVCF